METTVFLAVLFAAFLHAAWNVQIKLNLDRFLALFLLQILMGVFGIGILLVLGLPGEAGYPYAFISGIVHTGYNLFLARSYRHGDLSLVYPMARGAAPLLTLIGTFIFSHDVPSPLAIAGIVVLIGGLLAAAFSGMRRRSADGATVFYALGTAVFIAVYTVVDGLGGRVSGTPIAYAGLVFVFDAAMLLVTVLAVRGTSAVRDVLPMWKAGLIGGGASSIAYAVVIWAMAQAPIATVAALRETSIIFALLMSAKYLKETLTPARIAGGLLIVAGAVLLRLG
ncbi:MAG: DMT family transporter [Proteobacteria bacterium]|nr:DMT family transporter [Pseudomonadota bacterium]